MSSSGYKESHPHDIDITEEAPNYTVANLNTLDVETQQDKQREKNNETSYYILYNTTFNSGNST